jgi:SAM-dependent methyltransferase
MPERARTKHVHRLHPYLGKFIPQLVEVFLRKYFTRGQTVLDPFCGSGTTLVQANELGIHAIGYDISAFNVLLSRAKLERYDLARVRREALDILEKVRLATTRNPHQLALWEYGHVPTGEPDASSDYLRAWFAPRALQQLLIYRQLIDTQGYWYRDLLKVILSRAARSARLTTHFELDFPKRPQTQPYWCHKHSRLCTPTTEAFKFLRRYTLDTLQRLEEFAAVRTDATAAIFHADSRHVQFPPVDGVITSPPYVGLIDYHEQHAYAYHLLGLEDRREAEIGSATSGSSLTAQQRYQRDIAEVLRRAVQGMPPGGRLIIVANDRLNLYHEIAAMVGVEMEGELRRHVDRRTGMRAGNFYESVFIWRTC